MTTGWRGQGEYPPERPLPRASRRALVAIKGLHTLAWFSIKACMIYLPYAGFARRSDRRAAIAGAIVGGESLVFAASGFRCPLTSLAERLGARRAQSPTLDAEGVFGRGRPLRLRQVPHYSACSKWASSSYGQART